MPDAFIYDAVRTPRGNPGTVDVTVSTSFFTCTALAASRPGWIGAWS